MTEGAQNRFEKRDWRALLSGEIPLFFIGIGYGSLGDVMPFWIGFMVLTAFSVAYIFIQYLAKHFLNAVVLTIIFVGVESIILFSQSPLQAGILTSPGPDIKGLQNAGIEWQNSFTETVIELANPTDSDYSQLAVDLDSTDEVFGIGETTKYGCISVFGQNIGTRHRLNCPQLPQGGIIQLAVVTAVIQKTPFGQIPQNLFLPPRPPQNIHIKIRYFNGKRPHQCEMSKDHKSVIKRERICTSPF